MKEFFEDRLEKLKIELNEVDKILKNVSLLRLMIFLTIIAGVIILNINNIDFKYSLIYTIIFVICFISLIPYHDRVLKERVFLNNLISVNIKSLARLNGKWKDFKDDGKEFLKEEENFSHDLDVFGKNSLFQKINVTSLISGRIFLKNLLIGKDKNKDELINRQKAISELSEKIDFRQKIESILMNQINMKEKEMENWLKEVDKTFIKKRTYMFFRIYTLSIWMISIILVEIFKLPFEIFFLVFIINCLINIIVTKNKSNEINLIFRYKKMLSKLYDTSILIEKEEFKTDYCKEIINDLFNIENNICNILKEAEKIGIQVSDRNNIFYIILNGIFLMDIINLCKIETYKYKYGKNIIKSICIIGKIEALNSLATIQYENKNVIYPNFNEKKILIGKMIKHPLIGEKSIGNNFAMEENAPITLITGSNMAGKSTFLRTVGLNIVLAYSGAAVFANEFSTGLFDIFTVMRIEDDLQENVSSFYGEIKKIKKIIDECENRNKKDNGVFFLLDEIFKGTNSIDRHAGARALIMQLLKYKSLGMISTHDLELCDIEVDTSGKVKNFHFKEYYKDSRLKFDYKIRSGKSTTRNAKYLMDMAGIKI